MYKKILASTIIYFHCFFLHASNSNLDVKYKEIQSLHSKGILAVSILVPSIETTDMVKYKEESKKILEELFRTTFPATGLGTREKGLSASVPPSSKNKKGMRLFMEEDGGMIGVLLSPAKNRKELKEHLLAWPCKTYLGNNFRYKVVKYAFKLSKEKNIAMDKFILIPNKNYFFVQNNGGVYRYDVWYNNASLLCKKKELEKKEADRKRILKKNKRYIDWEFFINMAKKKDADDCYCKANEVKFYETKFGDFMGFFFPKASWEFYNDKKYKSYKLTLLEVLYMNCKNLETQRNFISPIMLYDRESNTSTPLTLYNIKKLLDPDNTINIEATNLFSWLTKTTKVKEPVQDVDNFEPHEQTNRARHITIITIVSIVVVTIVATTSVLIYNNQDEMIEDKGHDIFN